MCKDLNFSSIDVNIFSETGLSCMDKDCDYALNSCTLFRNDNQSAALNIRPYGSTAVYSRRQVGAGYLLWQNAYWYVFKITVIKFTTILLFTVVGVYLLPKVPFGQLCRALMQVPSLCSSTYLQCQLVKRKRKNSSTKFVYRREQIQTISIIIHYWQQDYYWLWEIIRR